MEYSQIDKYICHIYSIQMTKKVVKKKIGRTKKDARDIRTGFPRIG